MTLEIWLAYAVAAAVLLAIPGPTVMLVVSYGLSEGRRVAVASVAGVALGDLAAMVLSFVGLGAILATSAALFDVVKWVGAAYLIWLGVKMWRRRPDLSQAAAPGAVRSGRSVLVHTFAVTALNPKGIVFFTAFVP